MAQSISKPLSKKEQTSVLSMFQGTKQKKGIKNARTIAESLDLSRKQVMLFLNEKGLTNYADSHF
jgi:hypothetical protein